MQIQRNSSLHKVFTFRSIGDIANQLVNKNIPGILVDERNNIVECNDSQVELSIVKAEHPLDNNQCLPYYQVQVQGIAGQDTINFGLIARDNSHKHVIGKSTNSFGYFKGELFLNKKKMVTIASGQKLKENDYLGIGVNCYNNTFFVVKNGRIVSNNINIPSNWNQFYPAFGCSSDGQKIKVIFNPKQFIFKYFAMIKEIEQAIQADVKKEQINSTQIYPLVYQYLQFHGYTKSLEMLKLKEKDIRKVPRLTKNPAITSPSINLESKQSEKMIGEDDDMNEPLAFRHRIMSQRIVESEQLFAPARRKNTEMIVEPSKKKENEIDISNISNYNESEDKFYRQEEQRQLHEEYSQNQKFLLNQKVQIINSIKNKQIQKALQIIEKHIPDLLKEGYIVAFFKAHIFLRIVKKESNIAAIAYSKKQKETFDYHTGTLFPFYNSQFDEVVWNPLRNIFVALAYNVKNSKQKSSFDMLSDKQFHCFANYMNSIILKKLGYMGCSRLGVCLNHSLKVLQKIKDYKGYSCGLELTL